MVQATAHDRRQRERHGMREERTEVLVVGAGPVGLLTAILLAEAGIEVRIIDAEARTTTRSYACALHPGTLRLLEPMGLAAPIVERGRRVETLAFYEGPTRQAEVKLSNLGGPFPFMLILPQNVLEDVLEQRLRQAGVAVTWNHHLSDFLTEPDTVVATIEEMGATGTGYIVPHWEAVVKKAFPIRAHFLIGVDGHNSLVRQRLGIEYTRVAGPESFAVFEFESADKVGDEVRVVLDESTANVLWPLPGNRYRWTFQLLRPDPTSEFPAKERRQARLVEKAVDDRIRQLVEKMMKERAPWFTAGVKDITWCMEVEFEHRVARQFGRERCWLAGDAAHQTGPLGVQSMNVGMAEAAELAGALRRVLRDKVPLSVLEDCDRKWQAEWRRLLGLSGGLKPRTGTSPWVKDRRSRLLSCLPASHEALAPLASQLGLDV
jgi:2-polyprenyl-6-methoxyphenol hydroxylase-like FAD-dependent oxidoreductase